MPHARDVTADGIARRERESVLACVLCAGETLSDHKKYCTVCKKEAMRSCDLIILNQKRGRECPKHSRTASPRVGLESVLAGRPLTEERSA